MDELRKNEKSKTNIFISAINGRYEVQFLYNLNPILFHPYYISKNKLGKKVLYGRISNSSAIEKFEFKYIANIKVLKNKKFSPIIPIMSMVS
ncbi:MAG: hypothetical protein COW08_03770 [Ignavibacteriales bacterium CG12_big_fil_rev_8_21_14_0_65_30_8]|nr:MAG: hypothetical protein COW08_03770 [Ignavibacteriales bacterium CG12_big_fil_rev_8_21_14_0_65_30_8]